MYVKLLIVLIFAVFGGSLIFYNNSKYISDLINLQVEAAENNFVSTGICPDETKPFPSYLNEYGPPEWYCRERNAAENKIKFPIFNLMQNYPLTETAPCDSQNCPWSNINFKEKPREYLQEVMKYIYKDTLITDWNNPAGWYGAPFMHRDTYNQFDTIDSVGREFMHGLTIERSSCREELNWGDLDSNGKPSTLNCLDVESPAFCDGDKNDNCFSSWAVSFYNERGSRYIKKVWDDVRKDNDLDNFNGGFADGTVAVKFLFTDASVKDAAYLEGSPEWQADIYRSKKRKYLSKDCLSTDKTLLEDCFPKVRLLQIDIAVRDDQKDNNAKPRAPVGWVFATFTYHKNAEKFIDYPMEGFSDEEKNRINGWLKIQPVGLMWGNDPDSNLGDKINESIIFNTIRPQHLGCNGRLNGPVDNPKSSCLSCHALSESPKDLKIGAVKYVDISQGCVDGQTEKWFKNINPRALEANTFSPDAISLDYSLQLREGIFRYCIEKKKFENCVTKQGSNFLYERLTKSGVQDILILPSDIPKK